jgi:hypothetical protein
VLEAHEEVTDTGARRAAARQVCQHALELTGRHLAGAPPTGGVLGEANVSDCAGHGARLGGAQGARSLDSPAEAFLVW